MTIWKATAATVGQGRRNAFAYITCLCRNSWLQRRRNVIAEMPLPQQVALVTPQHPDRLELPLPRLSAPWTPQRRTNQEVQDWPSRTLSTPQGIRMYATSQRDRRAMVGGRGRRSRPPVLSPRGTGDRQPSDPSQRTQPCMCPADAWPLMQGAKVSEHRSHSGHTASTSALNNWENNHETDTTTSETTVELNHEQCHLELRTSSSSLCGNSTRIRGVAIQRVKVLLSQMNPNFCTLRAT